MPTLNQEGEFQLKLTPGDHEPLHVHVYRGNEFVTKINLLTLKPMRGYEYPSGKKQKIDSLIKEYCEEAFRLWDKFHPQ